MQISTKGDDYINTFYDFPLPGDEVTGVTISTPGGASEKQAFSADVQGETTDKSVSWEVLGALSSGTKITPDGKLIIDDNEKAEVLTIKATSNRDPGKFATTVVNLKPGGHAVAVLNGSGAGSYAEGDKVTVAANAPPTGQKFDKWELKATDPSKGGTLPALTQVNQATTEFTMPGFDVTLTATYVAEAKSYAVTVVDGSGAGSYAEGDKVTVAANAPPTGQKFDKWELKATDPSKAGTLPAVTKIDKPITDFVMPGFDVTLTASYQKETKAEAELPRDYTIKATADTGGVISPGGDVGVAKGADVSFEISANPGYSIADVILEGKSVGAVSSYTVKNVGQDMQIMVTFKADRTASVEEPAKPADPPKAPAPPAPPAPVTNGFVDVQAGDWFQADVLYASQHGLMSGIYADRFSPYGATTRGMLVAILHRLEGSPTVAGNTSFVDVDSGAYYEQAIQWGVAQGIVSGYGPDRFGPNDSITREQLATILYNYSKYKAYDLTGAVTLTQFSDAGAISPWAREAMAWAYAKGFLSGQSDSILAPQGDAQRAQTAAVLNRFCENFKIFNN